jgi:hypothetical protein
MQFPVVAKYQTRFDKLFDWAGDLRSQEVRGQETRAQRVDAHPLGERDSRNQLFAIRFRSTQPVSIRPSEKSTWLRTFW